MVRVRENMLIFEQMQLLTQFPEHAYQPYRYLRTIHGHKELHDVELALFTHMKMWPAYRQAWVDLGGSEEACPGLWGLLVREEREGEDIDRRPVAKRVRRESRQKAETRDQ